MIADLKPYPAYKDSGVEWLGDMPEHWSLTPNRSMLRRKKVLVGNRHTNYALLSLTRAGVIIRDVSTGRGKFSADMGTSQEVRSGDFIFCLFDIPETPRTVGLSRHNGMITGAYSVFECDDRVLSRFLETFYIAMDDIKALSPLYSGLRNTIPPSRFLSIKTPVPPRDEQAAIVRFLDYFDRRIRRYIRAKEKLITLLEEQKQALIHRAVTRGLDPNVRLKSSGVEWLGDVPEHWETVPLKRIAWFKSGAGFPVAEQGQQDSEIPFIKVSDMTRPGNEVWIELTGSSVSSATATRLGAFVFPAGSIIFPKVGGALLTNKRRLLRRPSCIDNNVMGCVVSEADLDYAFILLQQLDLGRLAKPGPVPAIGEGEVRAIKVVLPPTQEQVDLVTLIHRETANLDSVILTTKREISLLREYRTRLIADVITGKLDVREAAVGLPDEVEEPDSFDEADALTDDDLDTTPEEAAV